MAEISMKALMKMDVDPTVKRVFKALSEHEDDFKITVNEIRDHSCILSLVKISESSSGQSIQVKMHSGELSVQGPHNIVSLLMNEAVTCGVEFKMAYGPMNMPIVCFPDGRAKVSINNVDTIPAVIRWLGNSTSLMAPFVEVEL